MTSTVKRLAGHIGLALLATFPVITTPLSRMAGHEDVDVWNHAWGAWWFWEKLSAGELPWHCDLLYAPEGGTLWYIDPLGALFSAPLVPILGVIGAWNVLVIASVAFASWAAGRLATEITGPGWHTWVASVAIALGPYLNGELHNGISEAFNVGLSITTLAFAWRAFRDGGTAPWLVTGVLLGVTAIGTPYYAIGAALCLIGWAVPWLRRRPGRVALAQAAGGAAVSIAIAAPVAWLIRASVEAPDAMVHRSTGAMTPEMLFHNAVDPRSFFAPLGFQSVDYAALGEAFVHSGYIGLVVLALAWRGRRGMGMFVAGGVVTLVMALGPHLTWSGHVVLFNEDWRVGLPYHVLQWLLPAQSITHTLRLCVPALAVFAAMAAAGAATLPRLRWALLAAVALDMLVLAGPSWPLQRTEPLNEASITAIRELELPEDQDIVLDLPGAVGATMATSRYLVYQSQHGRPIPYRPDARATSSSLLGMKVHLPLALASERRAMHRKNMVPKARQVRRVTRRELAERGIGVVVVHRDLDRGRENTRLTEELLAMLYGEPEVYGDHALYRVRGTGTIKIPPAMTKGLVSGEALPSPGQGRAHAEGLRGLFDPHYKPN